MQVWCAESRVRQNRPQGLTRGEGSAGELPLRRSFYSAESKTQFVVSVCFELVKVMGLLHLSLILFSAGSFLGYGVSCVGSAHMKREFERYRLGPHRVLIGFLQLLAALGLLAGISEPWMGRSAAAGLTLMMLVGVIVRFRINDSLLQMTPAFSYMLLNAYLSLAVF